PVTGRAREWRDAERVALAVVDGGIRRFRSDAHRVATAGGAGDGVTRVAAGAEVPLVVVRLDAVLGRTVHRGAEWSAIRYAGEEWRVNVLDCDLIAVVMVPVSVSDPHKIRVRVCGGVRAVGGARDGGARTGTVPLVTVRRGAGAGGRAQGVALALV